ncbi:MAG: CvpA family protein, partial [Pseudomonadota bacterium]
KALKPLVYEIPVVSDIIDGSCNLALIVAFAMVFAVALIIVSIFTPLFSGMVQRSAIGAIDQGLGFLFGVARGVLLVLIALILYDQVFPAGDRLALVEESATRGLLAQSQAALFDMLPTEVPGWMNERFEAFMATCDDTPATDAPTEAPSEAPAGGGTDGASDT